MISERQRLRMIAWIVTRNVYGCFRKLSLELYHEMWRKLWRKFALRPAKQVCRLSIRRWLWYVSKSQRRHVCDVILLIFDTFPRAEVIRHLKCFDKTNVDFMYQIMNGFTKVLNYIADEVNPNEMIPNLCCSYQYMYDEGIKLVRDQCTNKTGPGTANYVMSIIENVLSSAVDLGCGKHNSLAVCNNLMEKEMKLFANLTLIGQKEEIKYTPVVPMLKIAQNLDSSLNIWIKIAFC